MTPLRLRFDKLAKKLAQVSLIPAFVYYLHPLRPTHGFRVVCPLTLANPEHEMKTTYRYSFLIILLASGLGLSFLTAAPAQQTIEPLALETQFVEIQTRGVIHEAFAQPVGLEVIEAGPIVTQQPPPPIPELPAELRPVGDDVQWMPGYWAWDSESNRFEWISGGYRHIPPGRVFVPGYWEQTPEGWRWISGFWASAAQDEIQYVPQPPAPLDTGPSLPPPGEDYFYNPGTWIYRDTSYVWQPGFYSPCQPGFVWVRPHYIWTPAGCVFVNGYWDFPLDECGLLFAPAVFTQQLWQNPGWAWQPNYALSWRNVFDCLFVDVRFGRYRFGDYYGGAYHDRGIRPWHAFGGNRYDPHFSYYSWQNRHNPNWRAGLGQVYEDRLAGRFARPPRTLAQQNLFVQQNQFGASRLAQPLREFAGKNGRFTNVNANVISQQKAWADQIRDARKTRFNSELNFAKGKGIGGAKGALPTLRLNELTKGYAKGGSFAPKKGFDVEKSFTPKKGTSDFLPPTGKQPFVPKKGGGNTEPPKGQQQFFPKKGGLDLQPPTGKGQQQAIPKKGSSDLLPPTGTPKGQAQIPKGIPNLQPPSGGSPKGQQQGVPKKGAKDVLPLTGMPKGQAQIPKGTPNVQLPSGGPPKGIQNVQPPRSGPPKGQQEVIPKKGGFDVQQPSIQKKAQSIPPQASPPKAQQQTAPKKSLPYIQTPGGSPKGQAVPKKAPQKFEQKAPTPSMKAPAPASKAAPSVPKMSPPAPKAMQSAPKKISPPAPKAMQSAPKKISPPAAPPKSQGAPKMQAAPRNAPAPKAAAPAAKRAPAPAAKAAAPPPQRQVQSRPPNPRPPAAASKGGGNKGGGGNNKGKKK